MEPLIVTAFYKFVPIADCKSLQAAVKSFCKSKDIKGTLILAPEGINGTLSANELVIAAFKDYLLTHSELLGMPFTDTITNIPPFKKLKIVIKNQIVTFATPVCPLEQVGQYVEPEAWNELITDSKTLVIDTRNSFEYKLGTFKNAINPNTTTFSEFKNYVDTALQQHRFEKLALFCTGGIRCEKASSYLLQENFSQVYHLQGGILKYLEKIPSEASLWEGECFVFDHRISVTHPKSQNMQII